MNTVGKPDKLGEAVRCVVSVSMLTEGWDANTVTHVLGVRAFGTQLLCEQVVGRGLRRTLLRRRRRRPVRARVRRGLRRAVQLHPRLRHRARPQARPDPDARAGHGGPHRLRDHVPAARRLPLGTPRRAPRSRRSSTSPASRSTPATCRPAPTSPPSSARPRSTASRPSRHARPAGRVPPRQAPPRPLLPGRRRRRPTRRRTALAVPAARSRSPSAGSPSASRSRTTPSSACSPWPQRADEAVEKLYQSIVRLPGGERRLVPLAAPVRPGGLDPLRRLRHHQGRLRHAPGPLPRQPRRVRQRLGGAPRRQARGPARRPELREEPGPRLHHPVHASTASSAPTSRTSSLASTTGTATTTCST